jgi:hypothetical protein
MENPPIPFRVSFHMTIGGVDPLIAKGYSRLAHALPRVPQILRQILRESRLGCRPAVVLLSFRGPTPETFAKLISEESCLQKPSITHTL